MQYILDKHKIEVYNISPFSLEDKIRELVGEVCFYNGSKGQGKGGMAMGNKKRSLDSLHPKHIDSKNKKLVNIAAEATVGYAIKTLYKSPQPLILHRTHKEPEKFLNLRFL